VVQVSDWLKEHSLDKYIKKFGDMNGSLLLEFQSMMHNAPEFFYKTLREDLKLTLVDILKFTKAIKAL